MKTVWTMMVVAMTLSSAANADVYKVDSDASSVKWKAGKKIGSFHDGAIRVKEGEVETDAKGRIQSLKVSVDMRTISNDDLKDSPDYQQKLVGHLSSDDFFKVEQFPESTFQLTSVTPKAGSKGEYVMKGMLTMIGKTQPIQFPAKISTDGKGTIRGSAKVVIERLKWGLQYGSGSVFKSLTADKIINDSFELTLDLVAKK